MQVHWQLKTLFCCGYVSGKAQRGENTPAFRQQLVVRYNRETRQLLWDACRSKGMIQFSGTGVFFIRAVQSAYPSLGSRVSETPWYACWASEGDKRSLVRSWKNTREALPDMPCLSSACAVSVSLTSSFSPASSLDPGMVTEASHLSCLPLYQASEKLPAKALAPWHLCCLAEMPSIFQSPFPLLLCSWSTITQF